MTVTGADDAHDNNKTSATISHTVSGGDYQDFDAASVEVTVLQREPVRVRDPIALSVSPSSVGEGAGATTITLTATIKGEAEEAATDVSVEVGADGDSATEGVDYEEVGSLTITIPANEVSAETTFQLTPIDDALVEGLEPLSVIGESKVEVDDTSITLFDNDSASLVFTGAPVTVTEGSTATYKVKLSSEPSAAVTVAITGEANGLTVTAPADDELTFTASNWNVDQTVTVSADEDDNAESETATLTHTASKGGYDGVTGTVEATSADDETASIVLSSTTVSVGEGSTAEYKVKLSSQPSDDVTVTISGEANGLTVTTPDNGATDTLTFTTSTWSTEKTVTVSAAQDANAVNETAEFKHSASGGGYDSVTGTVKATAADDETASIVLDPTTLTVDEAAGTATYKVKLSSEPTATVTVSVSSDAEANATVSPASLTFEVDDTNGKKWDTDQTVTVTLKDDAIDNATDRTATISHEAGNTGGYDDVEKDLRVTLTDDDTKGVTVSKTALTVNEKGGEATYTVVLDSEPTGTVTVAVASDAPANATVSPASLTFEPSGTSNKWDAAQTVTVTGVDDAVDNLSDRTATMTHTVSGADYGSVTAAGVAVTVTDDETASIVVSSTAVSVGEGSTAEYKVKLSSEPSGDVTVTITGEAKGLTVMTPDNGAADTLTFTTTNWSTEKTVTVSAAEDANAVNETAELEHSASGGGYDDVDDVTVTATAVDDDTASIVVSSTTVSVGEGSTAEYKVKLSSEPSGEVTVTISGEAKGLTVTTPDNGATDSLTFTTTNWSTEKTVTVSAAEDANAVNETAELKHSAAGGGYDGADEVTVTATAADDDTASIVVSSTTVSVGEGSTAEYKVKLSSQPSGDVTVAITGEANGLTVMTPDNGAADTLTFTTTNWSTEKTVTVSAAEDANAVNETAELEHSASGGGYDDVDDVTVTATAVDDDTASIVVSSTTVSVGEGSTAEYKVKLSSEPSGEVTVTISGEAKGLTVTTPDNGATDSLTFTTTNWSTEKTVTVSAAEDANAVNETAELKHSAAGGGYDGADEVTVTATAADDETRGVTISPTELDVQEDGGTGTYTVVLTSKPTADVTVTVASSDTDAATAAPASLAFTTTNWGTAQTVTVTGADDAHDNNKTSATVSHAVSGGDYQDVPASAVAVTVLQREPGRIADPITLTASPTSVIESGGATTITVTATIEGDAVDTDHDVTVRVGVPGDSATEGEDYAEVADFALTIPAQSTSGTATFTLTPTPDAVDEGFGESVGIDGTLTGTTVTGTALNLQDDDTKGLLLSAESVPVTEGGSATWTVRLTSQPSGDVTVVLTGEANGITVSTANGDDTLIFKPDAWAAEQVVTAHAAEDDNRETETAEITHAARGADYDEGVRPETVTVTSIEKTTLPPPDRFAATPRPLSDPAAARIDLEFSRVEGAAYANTQYRHRPSGMADWSGWQSVEGVDESGATITGYTGILERGRVHDVQLRVCAADQTALGCSVETETRRTSTATIVPTDPDVQDVSEDTLKLTFTADTSGGETDAYYEFGFSMDTSAAAPEDDAALISSRAIGDNAVPDEHLFTGLEPNIAARLFVRIYTKDESGRRYFETEWVSAATDLTVLLALAEGYTPPLAGPFDIAITFREAVAGFTQDDLQIGQGSVTAFDGDGADWTATIAPLPGASGLVTIDVPADAAHSHAGYGNEAAQQLAVATDGSQPTVTLASDAPDLVSAPFPVTITFSEDVTGFDAAADIAVTGGEASAPAAAPAGQTRVYETIITPKAAEVTVTVPAGVAHDAAGNGNLAAAEPLTRRTVLPDAVQAMMWEMEAQHALTIADSVAAAINERLEDSAVRLDVAGYSVGEGAAAGSPSGAGIGGGIMGAGGRSQGAGGAMYQDRWADPLVEPKPWERPLGYEGRNEAPTIEDLLSGTSFVLPIESESEPAASRADGTAPRRVWGLWGRGASTDLRGEGWDGTVKGAQLGVDGLVRDDVLTGLLFSASSGSFDGQSLGYVFGYKSRMNSIHPWVAWTPGALRLWASAGWGSGGIAVEDRMEGGPSSIGSHAADTTLKTLEASASGPVFEHDALVVEMRGEGMVVAVAVAGNDGIPSHDVGAHRLRAAAQGSWNTVMASGLDVTPSLEIGLRSDGGDVSTGFGTELGAGVAVSRGGLSVDGGFRGVIAGGELVERGINGSLNLGQSDGRGWVMTLTSTQGGSLENQLWENGAADLAQDQGLQAGGARTDLQVGYGFTVGPGVLTPWGGALLGGGDTARYPVGVEYSLSQALQVGIEGSEDTLGIWGTLRW